MADLFSIPSLSTQGAYDQVPLAMQSPKQYFNTIVDASKQLAERIKQFVLKVIYQISQFFIQAKNRTVSAIQEFVDALQKRIGSPTIDRYRFLEAQFKAKEEKMNADMGAFLAAQKQQFLANRPAFVNPAVVQAPPAAVPAAALAAAPAAVPAAAPVPAPAAVNAETPAVQASPVIAALNQQVLEGEANLAQKQEELAQAQNEIALLKADVQALQNQENKQLQQALFENGAQQLKIQQLEKAIDAANVRLNAANPARDSNAGNSGAVKP